jgi:hypothetical protein
VTNKVAEEILKYKDLTTEIERMRNVKTKVIPVIIGANRTISKSLRQYLSNTPGQLETKKLIKQQPYWALHTYSNKGKVQ